jgi:hypothetical protein
MRRSKSRTSPTLDAYLAALLADDGPGSTALAAAVLRLAFNPEERRNEQGEWISDDSETPSPEVKPTQPKASEEAKELFRLLRDSPKLRDYLDKVAKATTNAERGGFILVPSNGTDKPNYKVVEEVPKKPEAGHSHLRAWGPNAERTWDGAWVPRCAPFGSIDVSKLPAIPDADKTYKMRFWWHTHIRGWAKDSQGNQVMGEPIPSGDDLKDAGVVGMMVKFDNVTKQMRYFIIERNGKFYELGPKDLRATSQPKPD